MNTHLGSPKRGPDFLPLPERPAANPAYDASPPEPAGGAQPDGGRRIGRMIAAGLALSVLSGGIAGAVGGVLVNDSSPTELPQVSAVRPNGGGTVADAAAAVLPSVVSVRASGATGSGFVIDQHGHVLTNAHVVADASRITLVLADGRRVDATVIGVDEANDVAVLRASGSGLRPATLGKSAELRVGDPVLAVGSPLGLEGTVTAGIVSAVDRRAALGGNGRQTVIQTDAAINPGNSGGPLVNAAGHVVGVNTAIATLGQNGRSGNIGIGFAIPIDRATTIAERLIND